jgi:dTDP-4-amino-4,6-dideoxygalactose transaminase
MPEPVAAPVWRRQLPVHSPVPWPAWLAGARAAVSAGAARRGHNALLALLAREFAPCGVVLTDSGTTALTAAIAGIVRERPGAAVALPAFACYDLATAADGAGAPVLLYDVDPRTLAPDLDSVRTALRGNTAAIVVAHFYGYPVDLTEVSRLAEESGAVVIEDAAQAAGATLDARPAGAQASLSVLSFGRGKGWTGGGGGALLAFDDIGTPVLKAARAGLGAPRRGWSDLGALAAQSLLARPNLYAIPAALPLGLGETVYRAPAPTRGPSAATAAVLAASWRRAAAEVDVRRRNAARLLAALQQQAAFETIDPLPRARPGYLRLPARVAPEIRGTSAAARLGVFPSYPQALCDLSGFAARCVNCDDAFPGARLLASRLCTLPTHSRLDGRDLARLERWIRSAGR